VPPSVQTIGEAALEGCAGLKNLELPPAFLNFSPQPGLAVPTGVKVLPSAR